MSDFEEIAVAGGKLTFQYEPEKGMSVEFAFSTPLPVTVFQLCINMDGKLVDFVATSGVGGSTFIPQPSIVAYLISDREGMFGQKCVVCGSYFRTSTLSRLTTCTYCGSRKHGIAFLTENQMQYLTKYFNTYLRAMNDGKNAIVDLDQMTASLANNKHSWVYNEERQQSKYICSVCHCAYDVLGNYALCPACGTPNYQSVFEVALSDIQTKLAAVDQSDVPGELFAKAFTEYEALGNSVKAQLLRLPAMKRRKVEIEKINFQHLSEAAKLLEHFFSIKINENISAEDLTFLKQWLTEGT